MLRHEDLKDDEMVFNRAVRICFEDEPDDNYSTIVNGTRQEIIDHFCQSDVVPWRIEFLNCGKFEDEIVIAEI